MTVARARLTLREQPPSRSRRRSRRRNSSRLLNGFTVAAVAYLLAFTLYPTIYAVRSSLHNANLAEPYLAQKFVGGANYMQLISDGELHGALIRTLLYMAAIIVEVLLGFALGWAAYQNAHMRGISHLRALISLPLFVAFFVAGILWRYMLSPGYGVIPDLLAHTPLRSVLWLADPTMVKVSLDLVDIWQWTPFTFLIFVAALTSLPAEQLEAATVDGASTWQTLRHIVLPLIEPAIVIAVAFRLILSFQNFDTAYALNAGGPGNASELLTLYLYKLEFVLFQSSYGAALAVAILALIVLLGQVLSRINLDTESSSE